MEGGRPHWQIGRCCPLKMCWPQSKFGDLHLYSLRFTKHSACWLLAVGYKEGSITQFGVWRHHRSTSAGVQGGSFGVAYPNFPDC